MAEIDTFLFDLGGVLVEFNDGFKVFEWANLSPADFFKQWIASPTVRAFEAGKITSDQFADGVVSEFRLPVDADMFLENFRTLPKGLFDGAEDLLVNLRAEYRLACFSNTNQLHWPMLRDDFNIGELMDECFISCLTGLLKPDEEAFELVLYTLNCPPERIIYFDDNPVNTSAAVELGFNAFQVNGFDELEKIIIELDLL
jgi:HAD superfamily hydrolase (TIGR01509 family)